MLSTDTRSLRLSKALGQPIQILRQHSIPQTQLPTPPKSRRSIDTITNRKDPYTPHSFSQRIFNRTYYHKTYFSPPPPPPTPSSATTATIWTLIGLNTAIFALWQYALHQPPSPHRPHDRSNQNQITPSLLSDHTTLSSSNLRAGRSWTLLTSAFSHQEPWHFAFNMLSLKAFATILTHTPGIRAPHLIFLATGSALASSFAFLSHDNSRRQNQDQGPNTPIGRTISGSNREITRGIPGARPVAVERPRSALGSGMVLGFGAAATCLAPFTSMTVMFLPVPVPLWVLTVVYAAVDTYFLDDARSPVGHSAHLGGTVFGAVFYLGFLRRFGGILGGGGGLGRGRGW
ncbi:hypothetical protein KC331_g15318 [Hortaea werneckii]|uniref:Peptidase S54 rhomboid domain-containing protein n=1 Tax=Hortaea werneckii TaxID=91943 RepID=A0A3M7BHI5_HORWE|nr:hypothetical protein KC331_g15318 [Hortaea werneckii]KAI7700441.1 hypothetical protein KC353_g15885 [Hortaea werneckii]RMY38987.1 hypothetical protein D0865_12951 [Hortaea werneckii]